MTLGTKLHSLGITTLSIFFLLLCLILNYVFLFFISLFKIVAIDCILFLLHQFMGPTLLFQWTYSIMGFVYTISLFFAYHYYILSFLIVIIFILSLFHPFFRFTLYESQSYQLRHIRIEVEELKSKVDTLGTKVDNIFTVLENIEQRLINNN